MPDAPGFDEWHADIAKSPVCGLIFKQALGLPSEIVSNSLLTWAGIAEVAAALRLAAGQILVDLACGRGGYGREIARRTEPAWWVWTSPPWRSPLPRAARGAITHGSA
jgi:hypothetical protein